MERYTYCWEWEAQYRVIKPKKQKKEWLDFAIGFMANDAAECRRAVQRRCDEKGWQLVEVYYLAPTVLAFCFDNEMPDNHVMARAERHRVCPRPAGFGTVWTQQSAAQQREVLRKEAAQRRLQARTERRMQNIRRDFPLFADQLIAHEFSAPTP